jgi:hypothetical protein
MMGDANMCRGWKGVALVAACWCLYVPAQAQVGTYPSPVGAARMPEPIPCGPSNCAPAAPPPNLVPGPISPQAAPMGPPDSLSLPYDHTSAFQCEEYVDGSGMYFHIGPMALQRSKLGAGDIAVFNARNLGQPIGPIVPNPFVPTPTGTATALDFNSVTPVMSLGIRGTAGYLWGNQAIELSSFYIWENDVNSTVRMPFGLDTLFFNPPLTFVGEGLWRRASAVSLNQGSSLFNSEANYRTWNVFGGGLEIIAGVRYVRQNDILNIATEGTAIFVNSLGLNAPGRDAAVYGVIAHNNIIAPQFGLDYCLPLWSWFSISGMGKVGLGANYITTDVSLQRQDGLLGFDTMRHSTVFSQIYELGGFADFHLLQKLRLRLGFTATWLVDVAAANDQVNFNLQGREARQAFGLAGLNQILQSGNFGQLFNVQQTIPHGKFNNHGSMLYFGPQIELQFFF